jgi:Lon-like protease
VDTLPPHLSQPDPEPPDDLSGPPGPGSEAAPDEEQAAPRHRKLLIALATAIVIVIAAIVAGLLIHLPYYLLSPGDTFRTQSVISIKGATTYPQTGSVEYVTVSVTTHETTVIQWLLAHLDSSVTIAKADEIVPPKQTPAQNQAQSLQEMADSKTTATVVALEHLGYKVKATGTGAVIAEVVKGSAAAKGGLRVGDTVVAVDGKDIHLDSDLTAAIQRHKPGDHIVLEVEAGAKDASPVSRTVVLGSRPDHPTEAFLGVASVTRNLSYPDLPVQVSVSTPDVGGPSAGLAFTLGIMDVLTKGSITGGHIVATTGTMDLNGCVGPIGGMQQKVLAVKASHAVEFLVPRSEYAEAKRYAGSLRVIPVDDTDDALAALTQLGGGTHVVPKQPGDDGESVCKPQGK